MKKKLLIILSILILLGLGAKLFVDAAFKYMLRAVVSIEDFNFDELIPEIVVDFPEKTTEEKDDEVDDVSDDKTAVPAPVDEKKSEEAVTVPQTRPEAQDEEVIKVDSEKIETIEKSVSTKDKMDAAAILLSKLTASDIGILTNMIKDGKVTDEDFNKAKSLISERITEEEKELLKELFLKYRHLLD